MTGVRNPPATAQEAWDEERLLQADQALKEMYTQVNMPVHHQVPYSNSNQARRLRMTVPRLVNALASDQSSRASSIS